MSSAYREEFYLERDRRTRQYGLVTEPLNNPVRIAVGSNVADTPEGQALVLALVNMVCRLHRRVELIVDPVRLSVPSLAGGRDLNEACRLLALGIDPYIDLGRADPADVPTVVIGSGKGNIFLGADGYEGQLAFEPLGMRGHPAGVIGAGLAACLGAAALVHIVFGRRPRARKVSLWGFGDGEGATGPPDPVGPINIGDLVAMVGAGAVGSAVAYWLCHFGVSGRWVVVDGDRVELHNTNRSLGILAADAGWTDGVPGGEVRTKAEVAARLIGAEPVEAWYDQWIAAAERPDVLIPAGGEREIRRLLPALGMPFLIQGSTSSSWQAQLHRHGPADSCTACRFRTQPLVAPDCSTGPLPAGPSESTDAALPFLSAAAGLLVVAALTQLERGYLDGRLNQHGLLFGPDDVVDWSSTVSTCDRDCRARPSDSILQKVNVSTRWAHRVS